MNNSTKKQLIDAANNNNSFALTLLGTYLINSQEDVEEGVRIITLAADGKNVLWAKNLKSYLRAFNPCELPIHYHALIDSDAREQLENYIAEGDVWAMTILGDLLYQGRAIPQDRTTAEELLGHAAHMGCLYAKELVNEYGLSTTRFLASDVLKKFKNSNDKKFWLNN